MEKKLLFHSHHFAFFYAMLSLIYYAFESYPEGFFYCKKIADKIQFIIKDFRNVFDLTKVEKGNVFHNMLMRIKEIKGELDIQSAASGTINTKLM